MKILKRCLAAGILLALSMTMLTGCIGQPKDDGNTLTVTGRTGSKMEENLREAFPDIDFEFIYYDGWNTTSELQMRTQNQDIPDIYFGTLPMTEEQAEANLLDLSGYDFCDKFEPSILNQFDRNGHIYQLPGSVSIRCIIYNQKMFAEHGWQEPQNFDELVALCRQIREETDGITPIVLGAAANGYYFTTMTTFSQAEFLYSLEGKQWEEDYFAGRANAAEGFGTGIQMCQELIDAGAFDHEQNLGLWDAAVFQERVMTGQAAMQFVWGAQTKLFALVAEHPDDYVAIPFRNHAGDAVLGTGINGGLGLSRRLGEPGNEKKLENALRVMEWFSTEEGQGKINNPAGSVVYPIKEAENVQTIAPLRELWYSNLDGIKAPMLYAGYEDIITPAADYIVEAVEGEHDLSGLADLIDETHRAFLAEDVDNELTFAGTFAVDFTHEETVQMVANMIHAMGNSDITLVSDGRRTGDAPNREGAHAKFYEGPLLHDCVTVFVPGNYEKNKSSIVQMTLTGAQIQALVENGKMMVLYEGESIGVSADGPVEGAVSSIYPYYWTGMTVKLKDGKVVSMALEDGTPMEQDKTYTVSFAMDDYAPAVAAAGDPVELGFTAVDAITEYLGQNSPLSPALVLR